MQPSELEEWRGIRAVILKPTLLGLERATAFAREARRIGAEPVVSSSFESGVGVSILAQFAAALGADDTLAGLGTLRFLERDVLFPSVAIEHGRIDTDSLPDIAIALDLSRLTEVPLD